jgi:hypothetical protein
MQMRRNCIAFMGLKITRFGETVWLSPLCCSGGGIASLDCLQHPSSGFGYARY